MFSMTIIGLRGTHLVNLELLLTYFWGITVYISGLTLAVVVCLDSYSYLGIWINHEWGEASLRTLREQFCIPSNTAGE